MGPHATHILGGIAHFAIHHPGWAAGIAVALWLGARLMRPAPMSGQAASCSHTGGWVVALATVGALGWFATRPSHAAPPAAAPRRTVIIHQAPHLAAAHSAPSWQLVAIVALVVGAIVAVVINTRPRSE